MAQAVADYVGATFIKIGAADLPNGKPGAVFLTAVFDVAADFIAKGSSVVLFIDEIDTVFGRRALQRAGALAGLWGRFTKGLLVIGATNDPWDIAPKIAARLERKILVDAPSDQARASMIRKQLAEEETEPNLSSADIAWVVSVTRGRSAVNMERLISSAAMKAFGAPP